MRFISLLALPLLASALAAAPGRLETPADALEITGRDTVAEGDGKLGRDAPVARAESAEDGTVFNGKSVPQLRELTSNDMDSAISKGYWLVELFSPSCHHCKSFAPTWETLYELYYTSNGPPATPDAKERPSFTQYYDFHFARVDCIAFGDACTSHGVRSFPTVVLFKDGEEVKREIGVQNLKFMSKWVEETLETIHPNSRPKDGPTLPQVGAKDVAGSGANAVLAAAVASTGPAFQEYSVSLTAEKFQRLVTSTRDPWFIKFYAPWCQHCEAMAPNWQAMARQMRGKLNVGHVNCETEKRLCKDVKVKGYPTLVFMMGGERVDYVGLRGVGDLLNFAQKAHEIQKGVMDVNATQFEELEKTEDVLFLYFYDHATVSEDFSALDRLTMSLIGHAKLLKTSDPELAKRFKISTWPRLVASRDGKPSYYTGLSPQEMRDYRKVLGWMKTVWLPIVPELTAANAREIMDGKLVVLGILSRERPDEFVAAKREIKNAALEWIDKQTQAFQLERQELRDAKQLRIEEAEDRNDQRALRAAKQIRINMDDIERKEVRFAWVDGMFWERWIRTTFGISTRDGEKVVVHDEDNRRYWDVTMTGNPIMPSRTSILETLPRIVANPPKISPKSTTTALGHLWWVIRGGLLAHPIFSASALIGVILVMGVVVRRNMMRKAGAGFFKVGEKGNAMDGLLGNGLAMEKAD